MKQNINLTATKKMHRKGRTSILIVACLLAGTFTCLRMALPFGSEVYRTEPDCSCIEVKENEDLNILQAMPFPLLPALEVAYSRTLAVPNDERLLFSASNKQILPVSPPECGRC